MWQLLCGNQRNGLLTKFTCLILHLITAKSFWQHHKPGQTDRTETGDGGRKKNFNERMACITPTCIQRALLVLRTPSLFLSLSVSVFLARSGKNGAKMRLNANRSRVKSTKQGKQFLMPNEKQCSKLNEEAKKARIFVLKTVGGKNDMKTIKQSGGGGGRVAGQLTYIHIYLLTVQQQSFRVFSFCLCGCRFAPENKRQKKLSEWIVGGETKEKRTKSL